MKNTENAIEWLSTSERATVSITQPAMKSRIRKLAVKYPDACRIVAENEDGSMCVHIPADWIRISPPVIRNYSPGELARRAQLIQNSHNISAKQKQI